MKDKGSEEMNGKCLYGCRRIPLVLAICGVKNSGKTTFLEKLVSGLVKKEIRVAVVKHDGHEFEGDVPGTDSYRMYHAGAGAAAVFSGSQVLIHKREQMQLGQMVEAFIDYDVILLEGMKELPILKFELLRQGISKEPVSNPKGRLGIITNIQDYAQTSKEPVFSFDQEEKVIEKILAYRYLQYEGEKTLKEFTHFDEHGNAIMVDVSEKRDTLREATARGTIFMSRECFDQVKAGGMKKGDVLGAARIAGIMATKKTSELIPLCHILKLTNAEVEFEFHPDQSAVEARCTVKTVDKTGVEMEALTGVNVALLTIYDMCKAVDKTMELGNIYLEHKSGGKSGEFQHPKVFKKE